MRVGVFYLALFGWSLKCIRSFIAYQLGELRQQYHEEVQMMRILCHDAVIAAEQLGLSTDAFKREQQALAEQENKVFVITDHMEHSEGIYREKG